MRYWIYAEPASSASSEPVYIILGDKAIIETYFDYWCGKMTLVGKADAINEEDCILDWATIHWATEVTPEALEQFISAPKADNSVS